MRKLSMEELGRVSVSSFKSSHKLPIVIILDNVRSALNVGSAFRTADGFAVYELALCGITAQPPHREILKTALGATESVDWRYFEQTAEAIAFYRAQGYQVFAIEQAEGSQLLDQFTASLDAPIALIFGNEVEGVAQDAINAADGCIEIPQFGTKHSLNVSVCVGIVVWEIGKQFFNKIGNE